MVLRTPDTGLVRGAMDIAYRRADVEDGPELADMRWEARAPGEHPRVTISAFRAAYQRYLLDGLQNGERVHWVAEARGQIAAQVIVQRVPLVPRPCKVQDAMGVIVDNYTRPEYRGQGIGRSLLERAECWARENDLELLAVWSSEEAAGWYERRGFVSAEDVRQKHLRPYYDPA
jgi:GNAT superfamily N-acetyltransferase